MARYVAIDAVPGVRPGDVVDDPLLVAAVQANGGRLVAIPSATIESAAEKARAALANGRDGDAAAIMLAAYSAARDGVSSATTGATLPTISAHETLTLPDAVATTLATIDDDETSVVPSAQPACPTNVVADFDASWDGGALTVSGKLADGSTSTEVLASNPGGSTTGAKAFATITSVAAVGGGAGGHNSTVKTGALLGLAHAPVASVYKLTSSDGATAANEAIAASNLTNGTVTPTTAKDGSTTYDVWYTYAQTLTDPGHTHGLE